MCDCNCEFTYFNRPSRLDPKDSCHCVSNNPFNKRRKRRKHPKRGHKHDRKHDRMHNHKRGHKRDHPSDHKHMPKYHRQNYQSDDYDDYFCYRPCINDERGHLGCQGCNRRERGICLNGGHCDDKLHHYSNRKNGYIDSPREDNKRGRYSDNYDHPRRRHDNAGYNDQPFYY